MQAGHAANRLRHHGQTSQSSTDSLRRHPGTGMCLLLACQLAQAAAVQTPTAPVKPVTVQSATVHPVSVKPAPVAPVRVQYAVFLVSTDGDGERLTPVQQVRPGQTLLYRITYRNQTTQAINGIQPVIVLPAGIHYVDQATQQAAGTSGKSRQQRSGSALSQPVDASLDGQTFSPVPLKQGDTIIPAGRYRALRWPTRNLPAGQAITIEWHGQAGWTQPAAGRQTSR